MTATELTIDVARLLKVRRTGNKIVAQCPECAAAGGDRRGNHFFMNLTTGQWGCAAFAGDTPHRQGIFARIGIRGERNRDPQRDRQWREARDKEKREANAKRHLADAAKEKREAIVAHHLWNPADVWDDSPQRIDQALVKLDPSYFLRTMFPEDALLWTGRVKQSGTNHARRWRTVGEWVGAADCGPMTTPAIWKPGTTNRTAGNVGSAPFVVLDFDELDGREPETRAEIGAHVRASLAITRWLREGLRWRLAAIVWTGSKSIHAWFHTPPPAALASLKTTALALGIDAGLIGQPEHPCRLPGQRHAKTAKLSRVLWLQIPTESSP